MNNTIIKTTKTIYPQIYAYILPTVTEKEGWIKIGYTERKNVDERIREQTQTADLTYRKLWSAPARFADSGQWFKDHDFHHYLCSFKKVKRRKKSEWFFYNGMPENAKKDFDAFIHHQLEQDQETSDYQLRAEQADAVAQTLAWFKANPEGEFLWNAKPRFGKTLATYDLARKLDAQKVLIVTNRPAIANSWFDDFGKFIAWQTDFAFVSTSDSLKDRPVLTRDQFLQQLGQAGGKQRMIAFISLQDLKGSLYFGGSYDKLQWVSGLAWDLLVIDEAHEGVDTSKTNDAFDNIKRKFTLHLSGTPFKAVASGKFNADEIYNWSYADEQAAKAHWDTAAEENNPYEALPRLNLFSYQISPMLTDEINQGAQIDGENHDYAFDLNEFFDTNEKGRFSHEKDVRKWLDTLTVNEKYPFSTPEFRSELKHTFWLLNRVASAKALRELLKNHPVFENYEIILAAGDGSDDDTPATNQKALDRVRKAVKKHDKTITLSVGQLTTGVTIPEWTAVLMLSNMQSPAQYMQAAFRAQNPWTYETDGQRYQKQNAYVFDFAPERTLMIYDEFANSLLGQTAGGRGTSSEREHNIRELLNFFPVIAEDNEGKMVELDVNQVLTIPQTIKAREVVRRGFMSNLLFQNIGGIFASPEAREILEQLNPVEEGKNVPRNTSRPINTNGVAVDENGNVVVAPEIVIAETDARFGEKIYQTFTQTVAGIAGQDKDDAIATNIGESVKAETQNALKELAKEKDISDKELERISRNAGTAVAREVEKVQAQTHIERDNAKDAYEKAVAASNGDALKLAEAEADYAVRQQQIAQASQQQIEAAVTAAVQEQTQAATQAVLVRAEENKKAAVENDIRARLRGFSRTIPSFLMAYGAPDTTLANFDQALDDAVFTKVTGITLAQFRLLRDEYRFFDEAVFNEAVQEFLHRRAALADYFDENQSEDIFDYIPPQKTSQIFTPRKVVQLMLDTLEKENPGIFNNPTHTFADLYMKSGLYLTEMVKRLFVGLKTQIPDNQLRLKHILENQIYGFAPGEIIYNIARNFILGFDKAAMNINSKHIVCLDTTPYAMGNADFGAKLKELFGEHMKFDAVVGNPPYQESGEARDEPIYHHFYNLAAQFGKRYCLISPARFLFRAGQTPKEWNEKMLNDEHLRVLVYQQDSSGIFPNTDIKGGIAILYRDEERHFGKIGVFAHFTELNSIAAKVAALGESSFADLVQAQGIYRFSPDFFKTFPLAEAMQGKGTKSKIVSKSFSQMDFAFFTEPQNADAVKLLGLVKGKREYKWIDRQFLSTPASFEKWKVMLPEANGTGAIGEVLSTPLIGEPLIGEPLIGHTDTFLSIGAFDSEAEAQNALKYVKSKFARTMLGILKITQHNSRSTWAKVPLQDFTENSDIDWTQSVADIDRQLYRKYGLNAAETAFIESKVKAMD